jgi:hypothetical protein
MIDLTDDHPPDQQIVIYILPIHTHIQPHQNILERDLYQQRHPHLLLLHRQLLRPYRHLLRKQPVIRLQQPPNQIITEIELKVFEFDFDVHLLAELLREEFEDGAGFHDLLDDLGAVEGDVEGEDVGQDCGVRGGELDRG